jgi:hypothetical protein
MEEMFGIIREVVPLSDGGVLVYDGRLRLLRQYDSLGAYVHTIGRVGQGPGEYESPGAIAVARDGTVLVWDRLVERLNRYSSSGEFLGRSDVRANSWGGASQLLFPDSSGKVWLRAAIPDPARVGESSPRGAAYTTEAALLVGDDGSISDTILSPSRPTAADQGMIRFSRRVGQRIMEAHDIPPLTPIFHSTFSPLGYYVSGASDRYAILVHRGPGSLLRIESDLPRVRASGEERDALAEGFRESMRRSGLSTEDRWSVPESKPFFSGLEALRVDADGRIWARLHWAATVAPTPDDSTGRREWLEPTVYDVFEPDGTFRGRVRLPDRSSYEAAMGDRVWLIVRDEDDVERLHAFRMTPRTTRPDAPSFGLLQRRGPL